MQCFLNKTYDKFTFPENNNLQFSQPSLLGLIIDKLKQTIHRYVYLANNY